MASLDQTNKNNFVLFLVIVMVTVVVYFILHLVYLQPSFIVIAISEMIAGVVIGIFIAALKSKGGNK